MPTAGYGTVYDSVAKYTNSTSYEPRDHQYLITNNTPHNHSIRISSNNLDGNANKLSYLSQPDGSEYDVRMENGIKIISRKHQQRASSVDGSPMKYEYRTSDGRSSHVYGTAVENRVSRNYVKYTSEPYGTQPEEYVANSNQHYYTTGGTPQKVERVSYVPDYQYQTVPL